MKHISIHSVLAFIFIILTWSMIQGNIQLFARHWLWAGFGICLLLINNATLFFNRKMFVLFIFISVALMNYFSGSTFWSDFNKLLYEIEIYIFSLAFCIYLFSTDVKKLRMLTACGVFVIVITCISTIIIDYYLPGIVREVATLVNSQKGEMADNFYRIGVCDYSFPHAVPIIIPAFVMILKDRNYRLKYRIISLLILILIFTLVFISSVSTSMLCSIFVLFLSFIIHRGSLKSNLKTLILFSVILLIFLDGSFVSSLLNIVNDMLPSDNIFHHRLSEIIFSLDNKGDSYGDLNERNDLYSSSIKVFLSNIIFGMDSNMIGGHAAVIDRFAALGLLGGLPLISFIFMSINFVYKRININCKIYFLLGVIPFFVMITFKNMIDIYTFLYVFVLLPSILLYSEQFKIITSKFE